jgi:hypothetical protein
MASTAEKQHQPKNTDASTSDAHPPSPAHTNSGKPAIEPDHASAIVPDMEHFAWLVRKTKNATLLLRLLKCEGITLAEAVTKRAAKAKGVLVPVLREQIFQAVADASVLTRQRLERLAERIALLDSDYGRQAVLSFFDQSNPKDADILASPGDAQGRALHLYLDQEYPEKSRSGTTRFNQAEHTQMICRHWKSENYSSHYRGPLGATPTLDESAKEALKRRILELFPKAPQEEIVVEQFKRCGSRKVTSGKEDEESAPAMIDTLTVTFNGAETHYPCVENGEVVNHDVPSALSIKFSRDPVTGALSVFSDDRESRRDLAAIYRDVILAGNGDIQSMPILEFDLSAFTSPTVIKKLNASLIPGIENIRVQQIKVVSLEEVRGHDESTGKSYLRTLAHPLTIGMDRRETRDIYTIARIKHRLDDLTGYDIQQVKLQMRIGTQPFRKAHNVVAQMTLPNGFNDQSKTEDDRQLVIAQLEKLGMVSRF